MMLGLIFSKFLDLERGVTIFGKSKLNWRRNLYGIKIPPTNENCLDCDKTKTCDQCELKPKIKSFECEIVKNCKSCMSKLILIKYNTTENNKLERLSENEFDYMPPLSKMDLD